MKLLQWKSELKKIYIWGFGVTLGLFYISSFQLLKMALGIKVHVTKPMYIHVFSIQVLSVLGKCKREGGKDR